MSLDPDFKARWVAALRSGDYPQGQRFLNANGAFCCLGVACEIAGIHGQKFGDFVEYEGARSLPPRNFGLAPVEVADLMNMNDCGKPFSEIADYIEENL